MAYATIAIVLERLKSDTDFQAKVLSAANYGEVLTIVQEAGYDIDLSDLKKFSEENAYDFSEEFLESVAGGEATHGGETTIPPACPLRNSY